jgi:hypothetical protein
MPDHPQKITFGEMREMGVRGLLIYCADYRCSHCIAISGDAWPDDARLSDIRSASPAGSAASAVQMCGRISTGTGNLSP